MIVVDASALVAIGLPESDQLIFQRALERSDGSYLSPINYVEALMVLTRYGVAPGIDGFDAWLGLIGVELLEPDGLAQRAAAAYLRYGKGRHSARLNLGDCFAYALAKSLDAPLLYKGADFPQTDIRSAL